MPRRLTALALAASLTLAGSVVTVAQEAATPTSAPPPEALIASLCAATSDDEATRIECVADVEAVLADEFAASEELTVAGRVAQLIDDAVESAGGLDVPSAIADAQTRLEEVDLEASLRDALASAETGAQDAVEELRASLDELDLGARLDEALDGAADVDIEALLDEAVAMVEGLDPGATVDDLLAEIEDNDTFAALESGIATAEAVVAEAQLWVDENPDEACNAGGFTVGAGAAAVVGLLTDSPGFALAAYNRTHKVVEDACTA